MTRKAIPEATQIAVLMKSRRRCCLCYWIDHRKEERPGQIAHLDQNHENAAEANLVWLCVEHHDRYDSTTSQTKGYTEGEVRSWRDKLYAEFADAPAKPGPNEPVVFLSMALAVNQLTGESVHFVSFRFLNRSDRPVFIKNFFFDLNDNQRMICLYDGMTGKHAGKQRVEAGDERSFNVERSEFVKIGRLATDYVRAGVEDAVSGAYFVDTESTQRHVAEILSYKPAQGDDGRSISAYCEDKFFDIVWRWKWKNPATDDAEPVAIRPYCPKCDLELSYYPGSISFGPGRGGSPTAWNCTECHGNWPGHDATEVSKRIMKKKRSGDWKSLIK